MNTQAKLMGVSETSSSKWIDLVGCYWPLIFSLFYFMGIFAIPHSANTLVFLLSIYVIQVVLYHFMATTKHHSILLACIGLCIILTIVSCSKNPSGYPFLMFCTYFGALRFRLPLALGIYTAVVAAAIASGIFFKLEFWFYFPSLIPATGLLIVGLFERVKYQHLQREQKSQEEIKQLAQVAERERIARDLHDLMGHSLTTIALKSQLADKLVQAGDIKLAVKEINEVSDITSDTLSQMRSVISGYKAKSLDAVIKSLESSLKKWGFNIENALSLPNLSAQEESTVTLVLTEAVTNIIKHSQGKKVRIWNETIDNNNDLDSFNWALHIHDDGQNADRKPIFGNGLDGMSERLASINAELTVDIDNGFGIGIYFRSKALPTVQNPQKSTQNKAPKPMQNLGLES